MGLFAVITDQSRLGRRTPPRLASLHALLSGVTRALVQVCQAV